MGLDTDRQRLEFIRRLPRFTSDGRSITFIQPDKKPKVTGVQIVDPLTGRLGQSIFTADFPRRAFTSIPRTTKIQAAFQRLESPSERAFARRQKEIMKKEAIKLRREELRRTPLATRGELRLTTRLRQAQAERQQIAAVRQANRRIIKTLQQQGKRVRVEASGKITATDIITGRKTIISGRRVLAKVPISARVDIPAITALTRARERREEKKAKQITKAQTGEFTPFEIDPNLPESVKAQIRKEQANFKRLTAKIPIGVVTTIPKEKGILGVAQRLRLERGKELVRIQREKKPVVRQIRGIVVLGALGITRGLTSVAVTIINPIKTAKNLFRALRPKNIKTTVKGVAQDFIIDPVGTIAEFWIYSKTLNLLGKTAKRSPVGRFINEELYIRGQPREIQPFVRAIIKSSRVQEKLNPFKIKDIKGVNFLEVKSLNKIEAKVLTKTLKQTDSVVFGSTSSRTLSKGKTPLPKDVDLATRNVQVFNRQFINNLPRIARQNYVLRGQKIIRKTTKQAIMDIKPIDRLVPQRNLLGRGNIPVVGYVKKITRVKGKILPRLRRKPVTAALTVPTQKIIKVKGIRLVGFGEQTTRKGLGILQVLIEKNIRRAKDPQSFLIGLKVQLEALRRTKPKIPIGRIRIKGKINTLKNSIKILQSKEFARLLERKVPGITKQFPLVGKINVAKLKRINLKKVNNIVKARLKKVIPLNNKLKRLEEKLKILNKKKVKTTKIKNDILKVRREINIVRSQIRRITGARPSRLPPSRLPSRLKPSRLPSKIKPSRIPSRLKPSRIPSKLPTTRLPSALRSLSRIPSIIPTFIPISKIPPSRIPSRLVPSRVPPSRVPPSKVPPPFLPVPPPTTKIIIEEEKKKRKLNKLAGRVIPRQRFIFIADLYSRIYGILANPKEKRAFLKIGRIFTGAEARKIIRGRR